KAMLSDEGYDPVFGARPLKRVIQRRILDPLAMLLLEGAFAATDTVVADIHDGKITFTKGPVKASVSEEAEPGAALARS
ncbi:MAG: hypothetical protein KGJ86_11475, partial [Chloroflexota bacterium]|nr:hypothetical protein [Chloroflexota bacterium]